MFLQSGKGGRTVQTGALTAERSKCGIAATAIYFDF